MAALLYQWRGRVGETWKKAALVSMLLTPFGVVMSYSRGAVIGLLLVVIGALVTGAQQARRGIMVGAIVAVSLFSIVGWDSDIFFFERLEERAQAMLDPTQDVRESSRLLAYVHPFLKVAENPESLIFGRGQTYKTYRIADHAFFAKAYIAYGLIAAFLYVLLVIQLLRFLWERSRRRAGRYAFTQRYSEALLISGLGILPLLMFDHAVVSSPRGAMLFFLLLGLASSVLNFGTSKNTRQRRLFRGIPKQAVGARPRT
jgi:hypothetical protein